MVALSGYEAVEPAWEEAGARVLRARRGADGQRVLIKVPTAEHPTVRELSCLKREYDVAASLPLDGVLKAYALVAYRDGLALIQEDFGGVPLARCLAGRALEPGAVLRLGIQLADILGALHQCRIIHQDVQPASVLLHPVTGEVRLARLGLASQLSAETPPPERLSELEGTLAYMSPEQTGRINRPVDYRTDFYSLGVTLYEALSGAPIFPATDALEWVHCHIAREPIPLHERVPGLPEALSRIVAKLLAKAADERYQSAQGLKADLERCLEALGATGSIEPFALGRQDFSEQLQLPQKLYGREGELEALTGALEAARAGQAGLVLIAGQSGVGKSALVRELQRRVGGAPGYFAYGKFDPFRRNSPFSALVDAFQDLVHQVLTEGEDRMSAWRTRLSGALRSTGRLLVELVPSLELLIGPQPPLPELAPLGAQNRFHLAIQGFVQACSRPGHPLVLCLDDLQWADASSLDMLRLILTAPDAQALLVVGTFRDNEVGPGHPLALMLEETRRAGGRARQLGLKPLGSAALGALLADALRCDAGRAAPLAALIEAGTDGVPLLVNGLLKSLESGALLAFDREQRQWVWDLARIRALTLAGKMSDLIRDSVLGLAPRARDALAQAACLGARFDLRSLSLVLGMTPRQTAHNLWEAITTGLLLPLDQSYRLFNLDGEQQLGEVNPRYQFAHDRIHQAAYELLPAPERAARHWRTGQLLLRGLRPEEREQQLTAIVDQLNQGRELVGSLAERYELAELNLAAGRRARAAPAYPAALDYLRTGIAVLGEEGWASRYELALALHTGATEAAYLSTAFDETARLAEVTLAHARSLLDRVPVYESQLNALMAQDRQSEAAHLALWILEQLGIRFPKQPRAFHLALALLRVKAALAGRKVEELGQAEVITDAAQLAVRRILQVACSPAFLALPKLFPLLALKQVELCVRHGNAAESPVAYGIYAHILCVMGAHQEGARFGTLALELLERLDSRALIGRVCFPVLCSVRTWTLPLRELLESIKQGCHVTLEVGDFEFFGHMANSYAVNSYYSGGELDRLEASLAEHLALVRLVGQERAQRLHALIQQTVENLTGGAPTPWRLSGGFYDEEAMLPLHRGRKDVSLPVHFHLIKLMLCYLFRQHALAREQVGALEAWLTGFNEGYFITVFFLYDALSALAVLSLAEAGPRARLLARVDRALARLRKPAALCAANQLHRVRLVEAERARVTGDPGAAWQAYEEAICLARTHQHLGEEALARELAGRFQLELGRQELAGHYLRGAHGAYLRWGARAKARDLEDSFPELLKPARTDGPAGPPLPAPEPPAALDHLTIIKASQAISGEMALERLLEKLMHIVMENAGAQKGFLLLERGQRFFVEAEAAIGREPVRVLQPVPADSHLQLAHTVVHYVARTKAPLVLQNASEEARFAADPYILRRQPRSLLCLPLLNQGHITGILYLENNHAAGVFTPRRVELLGLLSAQLAISIENARLYNELELKVKERTAQLEQRNLDLQAALQHLREAHAQLVQAEKMASLGRLTAGISHEIKNPLNFVRNFAELNQEIAAELLRELEVERPVGELRKGARELLRDLLVNTGKLIEHGNRADAIIQSMLEHSRRTRGARQPADLKRVIEDSLDLACHGARGQYTALDVSVERHYDSAAGTVELIPEDIGRVMLNLLNNAFYSVHEKSTRQGNGYVPRVAVETRGFPDRVEIRVRDNGAGVPEHARQKIFEPFFTTKPPGSGTGLGLSLSYDIVQQGHGGTLRLEENVAEGASFLVVLPRQARNELRA